jgi:hypothetical protein
LIDESHRVKYCCWETQHQKALELVCKCDFLA